jgi:glycerate kinase
MRILVAMNAFKGSLSAREASSLVAEGLERGFREAEVVLLPLADGGDGTVQVLCASRGGQTVQVEVTGPLGRSVEALVGVLDGGRTVIIESAQASGLALIKDEERDARKAQSRGVGELMLWAARRGAKRIIVGVGGTAFNDGGIGAAQAAGGSVLDSEGRDVGPGTDGLFTVSAVSRGSIPESFRGIEAVAITDVTNPLYGPAGATRVYGPQKGLKPHEIDPVDEAMRRYGAILARDLGEDPSHFPGAGAGGGLGAGLRAFFGARFESGSRFVMEETGFFEKVRAADLVITGEGSIDSQTAQGKAPFTVAEAAYAAGVPVIALGGRLARDTISDYPPEFAALFSATVRPGTVDETMALARENLRFVAEQIGKLGRVFALSRARRRDAAAGGIVVRESGGEPEVLLIEDRWGMIAPPKGHPEPGEAPEEAAVREIWEETGIKAVVAGDLGDVKYRYFDGDGEVVEKVVRYFLMTSAGGELRPQRGETRRVMWVKERDLEGLRAYRDTVAVVRRALKTYRTGQDSTG